MPTVDQQQGKRFSLCVSITVASTRNKRMPIPMTQWFFLFEETNDSMIVVRSDQKHTDYIERRKSLVSPQLEAASCADAAPERGFFTVSSGWCTEAINRRYLCLVV